MLKPLAMLDCAVAGENQTLWLRWTRGIRRLRQRNDWIRLAGPDWARRIMSRDVTDRFHAKQGRSTGRLILEIDGERLGVYLKRHYRLPWWHGLLATLWPGGGWSPAFQELTNLEWARNAGLAVPRVAAAGEFVGPGLRFQSVLAVEELTDMLPINEAIPVARQRLDRRDFARWKAAVVREIASTTRFLHLRRRFHKDLYLCHFYLHRDDFHPGWDRRPLTGRIHLIDLHRLARHPWTWPAWQVKDLGQLLYSSEVDGITDRDRWRFWFHYLADSPRDWKTSLLLRMITFKWRRYRRHNLRRRAEPPRSLGLEAANSQVRGSP